jgi:predicted RNA-binding Zn-ribbon protein involved in translation (DUF1610 family)
MICPNKFCNQEVPDDSFFCDQCGLKILRCTKCGTAGINKFCGKCGSPMAFKESRSQTEVPIETPQVPKNTSATIVVLQNQKKLLLCHSEGWNLEISTGDILGRTNGNHTDKLGKFPVISSNHAKLTFENNQWFITDLKSTNKTYVGSTQAQPGVPIAIKNNDVIQLANVKFIVGEA